jgi:hypothetical protein
MLKAKGNVLSCSYWVIMGSEVLRRVTISTPCSTRKSRSIAALILYPSWKTQQLSLLLRGENAKPEVRSVDLVCMMSQELCLTALQPKARVEAKHLLFFTRVRVNGRMIQCSPGVSMFIALFLLLLLGERVPVAVFSAQSE